MGSGQAGKVLGRTGLRLSAFGAGLIEGRPSDPPGLGVPRPCNWCDLPALVTAGQWSRLETLLRERPKNPDPAAPAGMNGAADSAGLSLAPSHDANVVEVERADAELLLHVRVGPTHWDRRMIQVVEQVLELTGRSAVDVLQLAPFDLERIKAGEPFRRLQELREAGRARYFSVWTDSVADARWVVENTPAHALTLDAPTADDGWRELLTAAGEEGTGIIAGPATAGGDVETAKRLLLDTPITAFTWPVDVA
ncbi:MAG: hypothetical protein AMXMBFR83_20920 [Phycisphaerae bacterium]